jgi:hypothetical protein
VQSLTLANDQLHAQIFNTFITWAEGIRGLMGEKGLMEEDWNDRSNWRKKIIQLLNC